MTIPGHRHLRAFSDRYSAADALAMLHDRGIRPAVPAPGPQRTPAASPASQAERDHMRAYGHLLPDLRLTLANLVRAAEAMARLAELGWAPLEGYPGADQPWYMACGLCGWRGRRFWSHLRGRNGDRAPRPVTRHPGCIPVRDIPAALIELAAARRRTCPCPEYRHPTTLHAATLAVNAVGTALETSSTACAVLYARALLEPCPASTHRAELLRTALDRRTRAITS
ncbi:hypothetical protein ACFXPM_34215 [Streptomyces sp. NPDC059095]|uniref:hypothetical protein n=1 Tax=Streptomyces sp. NPDC059095 TaxID=3346726 RepID=UPI0036C6030A